MKRVYAERLHSDAFYMHALLFAPVFHSDGAPTQLPDTPLFERYTLL